MTRSRGRRLREAHSRAARGTVAAADGVVRSAEDAFLHLQRMIGNRATSLIVQRAGPSPTPYAPDSPIVADELGMTKVVGRTLPSFTPESDGKLAATTEGKVDVDAKYVAPGVHDRSPSVDGTKRRLLVTDDMAKLVRDGEQEHADDIWWGHQLVAGEAARAINALSTRPPEKGADVAEVHGRWRAALYAEISPKLRIAADKSDPRSGGSVSEPWYKALAALHQSTLDHDALGWHSMKSRSATAKELKENPVPADTVLQVAVPGGEIGKHPAEDRIRSRYNAMPDRT